jgi:hypothetical protein
MYMILIVFTFFCLVKLINWYIFNLAHEEFRLPELESLAQIENVKISYNKEEYKNNVSSNIF